MIFTCTKNLWPLQLHEGQAAYKMIWMQLKDLPLLLAGALGAAITGMIAPGLSFLFGEIQKVKTKPIKTNQFPGISPIMPYTESYRYIEEQVLKRVGKSVF